MTDLPRRTVLAVGVGAAGVMVLGVDVAAAEAASVSTALLRSDYARALGKIFTARTRSGRRVYKVRLEHIRDISHATAAQGLHSFNLIFAPVGSAHVPDGIYLLRSPHVREHPLFLSSIGSHRAMQALVNRTR